MLLVTLIILCIIYVVYILVGAAIFMVIEKKDSAADPVYVTESDVFKNFVDNNACMTDDTAQRFAQDLINEYDAGRLRVSNVTTENDLLNWSFDASIFFVVSVITTIGYGNIVPTTPPGKILFFFYALHGIPLTAVVLIGLGERIIKPYNAFERRRFTEKYPRVELYVKRTVSISLTYTMFSLVPAIVFMKVEEWTFLDSWYFTMVTLTTVGFGDLIPGMKRPHSSLYKVVCGLWMFFGLAWLSCVLSVISTHMTDTSKAIDNKIEEECKEHKEICTLKNKSKANGAIGEVDIDRSSTKSTNAGFTEVNF